MRFSCASVVAALLVASASSFCRPLSARRERISTQLAAQERRTFLATAAALLLPQVASAGLLDEFGTDPSKIETKVKSELVQPSLARSEKAIDPTLRACMFFLDNVGSFHGSPLSRTSYIHTAYYYPTAKKRYLPRIQKVSQEILKMPACIAEGDWPAVESFASTAENAILPLQLYQSSLDGQGLSMSNAYAKQMKADAVAYEKAYHIFQKALSAHNPDLILTAVADMGVAVADYRQQGRLSDDDGSIPSVDDMRRMAMRRPTMKIAMQ